MVGGVEDDLLGGLSEGIAALQPRQVLVATALGDQRVELGAGALCHGPQPLLCLRPAGLQKPLEQRLQEGVLVEGIGAGGSPPAIESAAGSSGASRFLHLAPPPGAQHPS